MTSTYSNQKYSPLTFDDLKLACDSLIKKEEKQLPKGLSWLTKIMNKFGWHRKYEILVFDKDKLRTFNYLKPPSI